MSMSIVKSHGGFVEVESEIGVGTAFHIYIPLVSKGSHLLIGADAAPEETSDGQGELILVVDDDDTLRNTIAETLESLGYTTIQAENGRQAVEIYKSNTVNLVLLDVVMPEMGGPEAAAELLTIDPFANVIFATC